MYVIVYVDKEMVCGCRWITDGTIYKADPKYFVLMCFTCLYIPYYIIINQEMNVNWTHFLGVILDYMY